MTDQTLSPLKQVEAIFSHELHRLSGRTRFIVFALIHSVLVVGTLLYFWIYPNVVRLSTFTQLTESVIYSLVIPITAMFFGGSIIAEEIVDATDEQRAAVEELTRKLRQLQR